MNREEAGEIILSCEAYVKCDECQKRIKDGRRLLNEECDNCGAWGSVVNPIYAEATETLGLPVPPRPEVAAMQRIDQIMHRHRDSGWKIDWAEVAKLRRKLNNGGP